MRVYTCEASWDAMLSAIYEAFFSGLGHKNIKLVVEPITQYSLFDEYIHVDADPIKANKLADAIISKISAYVYHQMMVTSMAYEEDALDNIYHVLIIGFAYGRDVLNMTQYRDIMRNHEIHSRVDREANRFQEITRFHRLGDVFIAHISPKSRVVPYLGPIFTDRMPSEHFMIIDDVHREAVVHPKDQAYYLKKLSDTEFNRLLETENVSDEYTDLWRLFFKTIAIKERTNEKCQMNHFPIWARIHADEFK